MNTLINLFFCWLFAFYIDLNTIRENTEIIGYVGFDGIIPIEKVDNYDGSMEFAAQ